MDNRTPAEIAYDRLKSGAAYVKADASSKAWDVIGDIIAADETLSEDEAAIAEWIDTRAPAAPELVMTDAPARTIEDIHSAQIAAWNAMDQDERLFASIVSTMFAKVPESHRAMGQAGMILLAAACEGIGEEPAGMDVEERAAAHAYRIAYAQGHEQGMRDGAERTLDYLTTKLMEQREVSQ